MPAHHCLHGRAARSLATAWHGTLALSALDATLAWLWSAPSAPSPSPWLLSLAPLPAPLLYPPLAPRLPLRPAPVRAGGGGTAQPGPSCHPGVVTSDEEGRFGKDDNAGHPLCSGLCRLGPGPSTGLTAPRGALCTDSQRHLLLPANQ